MADRTHIEWTDATWNPVTGCSVISPGCTNCYAMKLAGGRLKHVASRKGLTVASKAGPVWTGEVRFNEAELLRPLSWRRGRRIFVCAHGDLFHENVPDEWIDETFAVMACTPQHTYQVLTKRSARMRAYLTSPGRGQLIQDHVREFIAERVDPLSRRSDDLRAIALDPVADDDGYAPLRNVWLGTSTEDQARLDERLNDLLATPAARTFLSVEPMLGPVVIPAWALTDPVNQIDYFQRVGSKGEGGRGRIDWVIGAGESQRGSRPLNPVWIRALRDQCTAAGVAFFFKRWGDHLPEGQVDGDGIQWTPGEDGRAHWWVPEPPYGEPLPDGACSIRIGARRAGRTLDGRTWDEMAGARA